MRFDEALSDLEGRQPERMVPDLDRIRALAELLDHPELTYRTIHVTGTNGKTTTARLAARILCAQGVRAGLYTSPHLASVTERLALCNEPIREQEFADVYAHLLPYLEEVDRRGERVTYFETLTALAYLWFADKPVEVGVFEVGMGGTWDATNLIRSEVAAICRIGLDHPELGSTVEEVATEKAGIIKSGSVAVIAEQRPEALAVIEARAAEVGADLRIEGRDFAVEDRRVAVGGQVVVVRGLHAAYPDLFVPLHGRHQAHNTAIAIASCEAVLRGPLTEASLRETLAVSTSPGRLEVVSRRPLVVLDGAHNPDGAAALATALGEEFVWQQLHLVIGVLETKDVDGIVEILAPRADAAYVCANGHPGSLPPERIAVACEKNGLPVRTFDSVASALDAAEDSARADDIILVTGSLYTVADARPRYVKD
ncbi:MAG TPA: folylpolyglutamate synthase/dihydrofolate synthase family protein [Actinomycetota bacterium]|nr:folylpolyglutamate synthase/dihydrofolate synthase family protein [Actinomycetota bacterium]